MLANLLEAGIFCVEVLREDRWIKNIGIFIWSRLRTSIASHEGNHAGNQQKKGNGCRCISHEEG